MKPMRYDNKLTTGTIRGMYTSLHYIWNMELESLEVDSSMVPTLTSKLNESRNCNLPEHLFCCSVYTCTWELQLN